MDEKKVEIIFGKDGSVKTEVFGAVGEGCISMTSFLDDLFGKPKERVYKDEYHQTEKNNLADGLPSGHCG